MRVLFLLLVLANVLFFAYARQAREGNSAEAQIRLLQINPEKIKLMKVTGGAPVERPKPSPKTVSATPAACLEWGVFTGPEAARAEAALAELALPQAQLVRSTAYATGYWVHIPPLKTKADMDRNLGELKTFGVTDFSAVQDPNLGRNAISLGIFSNEEAAKARLAELKEKRVRSAIIQARDGIIRQVKFLVREPTETTMTKFAELQPGFPGSELKAVPCPATEKPQG